MFLYKTLSFCSWTTTLAAVRLKCPIAALTRQLHLGPGAQFGLVVGWWINTVKHRSKNAPENRGFTHEASDVQPLDRISGEMDPNGTKLY